MVGAEADASLLHCVPNATGRDEGVKHQYVGDVNDFVKYATLRAFGTAVPTVVVCWMLTDDDGRGDGRFLHYLRRPEAYRPLDPILFDGLRQIMASGERNVRAVEQAGLLGSALFFSRVLLDDPSSRSSFFSELLARAPEDALVFFDPDNGLEVASVARGRRNSRRYLYLSELEQMLKVGCTVVVYQHFPRKPRQAFLNDLLGRLSSLGGGRPFAVYSSQVAFLVCGPSERLLMLRAQAATLIRRSQGLLALADAPPATQSMTRGR
jgi:hypothetical protein